MALPVDTVTVHDAWRRIKNHYGNARSAASSFVTRFAGADAPKADLETLHRRLSEAHAGAVAMIGLHANADLIAEAQYQEPIANLNIVTEYVAARDLLLTARATAKSLLTGTHPSTAEDDGSVTERVWTPAETATLRTQLTAFVAATTVP